MKNKRTVEQDINEFFSLIEQEGISDMITMMFEVFELYDVDENDDWVKDEIQNKDTESVAQARILKTVYLLSKMADQYAAKLLMIKTKFPRLWLRMQEQAKQKDE